MNFSTKAEYGLRAMVVLANHYPNLISVTEISKEENISMKYLEHLAQELRRNDLVVGIKGKGGGYVLSREPGKISVSEIVEALEGRIDPMQCQSGECKNKRCVSKQVWVKLGKEIKNTLSKIKLSELVQKSSIQK